eukprot:934021-Prymnesium_polylepis.1
MGSPGSVSKAVTRIGVVGTPLITHDSAARCSGARAAAGPFGDRCWAAARVVADDGAGEGTSGAAAGLGGAAVAVSMPNGPVKVHSSCKVQTAPCVAFRVKASGAEGAEYLVPSEHTTVAPRTSSAFRITRDAALSVSMVEGCSRVQPSVTELKPSARAPPRSVKTQFVFS